jgi:hypothetical protein
MKLMYSRVDATVARGVKAITMIYSLTTRIPVLMQQSHLESKEAWAAYWSPIFRALTTQCTNPCREIRHQSFASLQRALFSPELTSGEHEEWTAIFGEVLLPKAGSLLLRSSRYERDKSPSCYPSLQDIPALSGAAFGMGWHARSLVEDLGYHG